MMTEGSERRDVRTQPAFADCGVGGRGPQDKNADSV